MQLAEHRSADVRSMSVGVRSELASKSRDRSEFGEHADKKSDSNFPHDARGPAKWSDNTVTEMD